MNAFDAIYPYWQNAVMDQEVRVAIYRLLRCPCCHELTMSELRQQLQLSYDESELRHIRGIGAGRFALLQEFVTEIRE